MRSNRTGRQRRPTKRRQQHAPWQRKPRVRRRNRPLGDNPKDKWIGGCVLFFAFQAILFTVLKLSGAISWPWKWTLWSLWCPLVAWLGVIAAIWIGGLLICIVRGWLYKLARDILTKPTEEGI